MNKSLLTIPLLALAIACENPEPETITVEVEVEVEVERDCITGVNLTPIQTHMNNDVQSPNVTWLYGSAFEVSLCDEYYMAADIEITYGNYNTESWESFSYEPVAQFGPKHFTYFPLVDFEPHFIQIVATYTDCLELLEDENAEICEFGEVWTEYNYIEIR